MNYLDLNSLAKTLAVEMTASTGELWRAVIAEEQNPHIQSPTAWLYLRDEWRTHRLSVSASAPHGMKERKNGESITCDAKRPVNAIAQDITRRLLANARAHLMESTEYDLERRKEEAKRNLRKNLIMQYLPKEYQNDKFCTIDDQKWKARVYASPTYDNLINIEVNLPLPEALKLLKQLTQGD